MPLGITNAEEYRQKVEGDLADLMSKIDDARLAINAVTSTYHMTDWLWAHRLKQMSPRQIDGVTFRNRDDFLGWLDTYCPHFRLVQELTNGSKHAYPVHSGGRVAGYGAGPFGIGPLGCAVSPD